MLSDTPMLGTVLYVVEIVLGLEQIMLTMSKCLMLNVCMHLNCDKCPHQVVSVGVVATVLACPALGSDPSTAEFLCDKLLVSSYE